MINFHAFAEEFEKIAVSRDLLSRAARSARVQGKAADLFKNLPFDMGSVGKRHANKRFNQATKFNKAIDKKDKVGLLGRVSRWFEDGGYKGGKDRG